MDYGATHLTARKTKIKSLWKQSKFEGSDREVRGRVLKQLTKNKWTLAIALIKQEFPHKEVEKILHDMQNEQLIKWEEKHVWIE